MRVILPRIRAGFSRMIYGIRYELDMMYGVSISRVFIACNLFVSYIYIYETNKLHAINTRDIETPYIISNSYRIPYIIRENPARIRGRITRILILLPELNVSNVFNPPSIYTPPLESQTLIYFNIRYI